MHIRGRFDADTARIEGHAFADQTNFSQLFVCFFFGFSIIKPLKYYWILAIINIVFLLVSSVFEIIPFKTIVILFSYSVIISVINYIHYITLSNEKNKFNLILYIIHVIYLL